MVYKTEALCKKRNITAKNESGRFAACNVFIGNYFVAFN